MRKLVITKNSKSVEGLTQEEIEQKMFDEKDFKKRLAAGSYIKQRRKTYPSLGDFADAYVKQLMFEMEKDPMKELVPEMSEYIERCLEVKRRIPKPEGGVK